MIFAAQPGVLTLSFLRNSTGWLVHDVIHLIFDQLKPTFVVAVDLEDGATVDLWKDYRAMYERSARHVNHSTITGFKGEIF